MLTTLTIDSRRADQITALAAAAGLPIGQYVDRLIGDTFGAAFPETDPPGLKVSLVDIAACLDLLPRSMRSPRVVSIEVEFPDAEPVALLAYHPSAKRLAEALHGLADGTRTGGFAVDQDYSETPDRLVFGRKGNGIIIVGVAHDGTKRRHFSITRGLLRDYACAIDRAAAKAAELHEHMSAKVSAH